MRSFDRRHTLQLLAKGVDFELRETYESALLFGRKTLEALFRYSYQQGLSSRNLTIEELFEPASLNLSE